jgi:DNA-binding NarL/FixJ family response regulator
VRVLVADDNPVVRAGMVAMLSALDDVDEVLVAADGAEAVEHVDGGGFDAVFLDVRMPVLDGLGALRAIDSRVPVVMLTHSDEPEIVAEALVLGARGYLVHGTFSAEELISALRVCRAGGLLLGAAVASAFAAGPRPSAADRGGPPADLLALLTEREREVMELVARGLSNGAIARSMFLSEKTVKNHLNRIYDKLGFSSRAEAVAAWHGARGA